MRKLIFALLLTAVLPLQAMDPAPSFPSPSWFRQRFQAPRTRVELQAPRSLDDYAVDGKLQLTLKAYLELVLLNNADIAVSRLTLESAENSAGSVYSIYDPSITSSFGGSSSTSTSIDSLQGQPTYKYSSQSFNGTFTQMLSTGTSVSARFGASRSASNAVYSIFNPTFGSTLSLSVTQPLLQNRWGSAGKMSILSARASLRISRYLFEYQLTQSIASAENLYWNVVSARENLNLAKKLLEQNASALDRARKMVQVGASLPLELYQPESSYASAQLGVLQAERSLARQEAALRQQIGADLDPAIRDLPVALTEPLDITPVTAPEKEAAVALALKARPDLRASELGLDADDIGIRKATDALRPSVSVSAGYTSQGVGGTYVNGGSAVGGMGDALRQVFRFASPAYTLGVNMTLPVRDRAGAVALENARIAKQKDAINLRNQQQTLRRNVIDAVDSLETARAALEQARRARDYAAKRLETVQKQYELGTAQMYFVLDSQTALSAAENAVLAQSVNYRLTLVNLFQLTGRLLEERGIIVE